MLRCCSLRGGGKSSRRAFEGDFGQPSRCLGVDPISDVGNCLVCRNHARGLL